MGITYPSQVPMDGHTAAFKARPVHMHNLACLHSLSSCLPSPLLFSELAPVLRRYNTKKDILFLPMSGLLGHNIKDKVPPQQCRWYPGPTLFELLDNADPLPRDPLAPFRMSVIDRYKDMGTIAMGKSESGIVRKGDRLYVMPNKSVRRGHCCRSD